MKKLFVFFIAATLFLSVILSGCSIGADSRTNELNDSLESTYNELTSTFSGSTIKFSLVTKYLASWANNNNIQIAATSDSYMVLINPATEGCDNVKSTILQCSIDTDNATCSLQPLSISLTALLGPENHGKIKLIITETKEGERKGALDIPAKYCRGGSFINMAHNDDVQLFTSGAYTASSVMTTDISTTAPKYPKAYSITLTTSGHHDPFDLDGPNYPNPIETIGNLLASCKSSGKLFELSSFECESVDGYIPTAATAVIVIDRNDVESIRKKFNSSYNNMKKRFEKLEDNFVYTFTETSMPETVMTTTSSDNIISLMYTLKTGTYLQDEDTGEIISTSKISNVTTANNKFELTTVMRSTDETVLTEMSEVFNTTSGLCDINYSQTETTLTWPSKNNKTLSKYFAKTLGAKECVFDSTLENSECDIFASKVRVPMISYRCNIHHGEAAISNICRYLTSLTESETDK